MRNVIVVAWLVAAMFIAVVAPAAGQESDDLVNRIISVPVPKSYRVDGAKTDAKVRADSSVQGGSALRVEVPGKSEQTWSTSVAVPINKSVRAGDNLILAFWARLEKGDAGAASAQLPYNAIQMAGAPYTALFNGAATVGPEWKMHEVRGKANRDYASGELNASIHLATGKQTVDIGPVFVLNMGQ